MGQETPRFLFGEAPSSKGEKNFRRRGLSLLFSLLFHSALLAFLANLHLFFPVEMPERMIYEVVISEPESLNFPAGEITFSEPYEYFRRALRENLGESGVFKEEDLSNEAAEGIAETSAYQESTSSEIFEGLSADNPQNKSDAAHRSSMLSEFRLDLPEDQNFRLSLKAEQDRDLLERSQGSSLSRELNIPKVRYSGGSRYSFPGYYRSLRRTETGGINVGRRSSYSLSGFDISPWAEEMIRKIQENWIIPEKNSAKIKGSVGIFLVLRKNGDLISAEIVESSGFSSLDQAALQAVDASVPLPELPGEIPSGSLEVYLVFDYDD
jgi:TonB family protein